MTTVLGVTVPVRYGRNVLSTMDDFFADAAAGKLPPVVFLDADFTKTGSPDGEDEHPPSDLQLGQRFTSKIVGALFGSPQWKSLAFFLAYDEHGGLYDHLAPPKACAPDGKLPIDKEGKRVEGAFDRYGVRVPFLVVSPTRSAAMSRTGSTITRACSASSRPSTACPRSPHVTRMP